MPKSEKNKLPNRPRHFNDSPIIRCNGDCRTNGDTNVTGKPSRRSIAICATAALAMVTGPASLAYAHAAERMVILTLPTRAYFVGAVATIVSTVVLAASSRRFPAFRTYHLMAFTPGRPGDYTCWASTLLLWALTGMGFFGQSDPLTNPLSLAIWTGLWVVLPLLTACFGNVWSLINPWVGPVRLLRRILRCKGRVGLGKLGHWPACLGFFGFAWFEIVHLSPADPQTLAWAVTLYWCLILALALLEGEAWLATGEAFTVYFRFLARVAPVWFSRRGRACDVKAGLPGTQILNTTPVIPGTFAFICLVLAAVSFDGLSETFRWLALLGINPLEFPGRSAVTGANTLGLILMWLLVATLIGSAVTAGCWLGSRALPDRQTLARHALTLLPISAAYHVAHYLIALLTNGQYVVEVLNDPLGTGAALLSLGPHWVSFAFLTRPETVRMIWNVQFALVVGAHVIAIMLAQRINGPDRNPQNPLAHLPMAVLMIAFTVFGLWLLTTATGT